MRHLAVVLLLALSQQACLAHTIAGIGSDETTVEPFSVPPLESDAKLRCGEVSCTSAPLEQPYRAGRSRTAFWATWLLEVGAMVYGIYGLVDFVNRPLGSDTGINYPAIIAFDVGGITATLDIIAYAGANDYGRQQDPIRFARPVVADFRGLTVPLRVSDVMAPGQVQRPANFSVATAARRVAPLPPPGASAARATPPAGAKVTHGKVAVLDLKSSAKDLNADDIRYFGDLVRAATLKAAPQLEVMTRENLLVLLQSSGRDIANCEGECEVDTGRRIGADAIVSGEVLKVGTRYKLTLRLHDTHEGKLLGAAVASGKSIEELDDSTTKAAMELFGSAK